MNNQSVIAERYAIKTLIGQGGMADVYLARDIILDRDVAIKILRSHLADDAVYVQRFAREASAAATLSHRNIVKIYDVGEENNQYYIVMEYVPGTTLKELIYKRGALHVEEAIDIMRQLISGVQEAHRNGIIHRDLKPQNILVTDSGVLKIADFGIAMVQSFVQVTESETIMGSVHYLAPEIIRGEKATEQSDIYALGIIFYELLRGQVPFNDDASVNIALKHMREDMPLIRDFNPTISQGIENVIMKATAKNIEERFETASDMLYALDMAVKYPDQEKITFQKQAESDPTIVYDVTKTNIDLTKKNTISKNDKERLIKQKKKRKYKYISIGAASVLFVIVVFFIFEGIFGPSKHKMPDLTNLTVEQAIAKLEEYGLVIDEETRPEENSSTIEKGKIIKTSPSNGSEVREGDKVIVTISKGKELKIEDYEGRKYEVAATDLEKMGFKVNKQYIQSERYSAGIIISQSITPGTIVDNNSVLEITLVVSEGYSVTVESVVGLDINSAIKLLELQGLKAQKEILPSPTDPNVIANMKANVVMKQTYENQTITSSNTVITLYYYDHVVELPRPDPDPDGDNDTDQEENGEVHP